MLEKTRSVLHRQGDDHDSAEHIVFSTPFEEKPEDQSRTHTLEFDRDVWDDMDQPEVITMTVEPGDKLNNGTSE